MTGIPDPPDFTTWSLARLLAQRDHLAPVITVSAGQGDPETRQVRAEYKAICAEITRRAGKKED